VNKQMEAVVTEVLTKALKAAETTGEFLTEQTPEVVQQLLLWNGVSSAIKFGVCVILLLLIAFKWIPKSVKACQKVDEEGEVYDYEEYSLFLVFWVAPIAILVGVADLVWLKILIAPKLYLLEYASSLVR